MNNAAPYSKQPPEYPRHQRHYFQCRPHSESGYFQGWMDVYVKQDDTIEIIINDYGVNIDGSCIKRPTWLTQEILDEQKPNICIK